MGRHNSSVSALERRLAFALLRDRFHPPKVIEWPALPPPITEERRQANLARSAEIRTALHSYLKEPE